MNELRQGKQDIISDDCQAKTVREETVGRKNQIFDAHEKKKEDLCTITIFIPFLIFPKLSSALRCLTFAFVNFGCNYSNWISGGI
jgi:hypothetical protein